MKIQVKDYEKKYKFELKPITQICGQNIITKKYIIESIRRYFSGYKYAETKNRWRDNIEIDGELVGRKYYEIISISGKADLLEHIKMSKQSLMTEYLTEIINDYESQQSMEVIGCQIEKIFMELNNRLNDIGNIELTYSVSAVWDMIQKSYITSSGEENIEDMNGYEMYCIFFNILEKVMNFKPKRLWVILENIDHLVSSEEYEELYTRMHKISQNYEIYFIISISLDRYAIINKSTIEGVVIINNEILQLDELHNIKEFIEYNYPYNKEFDSEKIIGILRRIVHKIGKKGYLTSVEDNVVCKVFNDTLLEKEKIDYSCKKVELAFLET
ncbi:MAG: hypothetical protein HDT40_04155 [Lachnospiraceae bacterium]|nr:hypothetical protein [Lachnospiraceae bacterium]